MQLSIPTRSLLPRAGPYSRAIVGYGIHWNHPAECTTRARGSCRPSPEICLWRFSFRALPESWNCFRGVVDLRHGPRALFCDGIARRLWVLQSELQILPPRGCWFQRLLKSRQNPTSVIGHTYYQSNEYVG